MLKKMLCLVLAVAPCFSSARAETTVQLLMRQKLESAHGLLDALALGDFAKMEHHAEQLREISVATTWYRPNSPEFMYFAKSFQNSTAFLIEAAKQKNWEDMSMGYIRVTLDCLQCHNVVRAKGLGK